MKAYGGVDVYIHVLFTSAPFGGEWTASGPGRFNPGETAPAMHLIGQWYSTWGTRRHLRGYVKLKNIYIIS
jgi:hypothetical protein